VKKAFSEARSQRFVLFYKREVKQKNSPCKKQAIYKKSEMLFSLEDHNTKLKQQANNHGIY
jgi:hypothetical protein